jgi:Zn-dependent peptidase ImmA (M78 family)
VGSSPPCEDCCPTADNRFNGRFADPSTRCDTPPVPTLDSNRGAKRAREARADLHLDPTAPLDCILTVVEERAQLPVVVAHMGESVAGACWRMDGAAIVWVNGRQPKTRQRFTLAHELGHVRCGHEAKVDVDTVETLNRTDKPVEVQANAFSAEFLLPRAAVKEAFEQPPRLDEVVELAARYGVSAYVALFSLQGANVIDAPHAKRLRQEIDNGALRWLEAEPLDDRLERIAELPYTSPALKGSVLASLLTGTITLAEAARAAGVPAEKLAPALETFAR